MTRRISDLALMLPPELADGELHRQDLLARAHRFHHTDLGAPNYGSNAPSRTIPPRFDGDSGSRAVAAAEDLIRHHQAHHRR
jgi:hypothetical protein